MTILKKVMTILNLMKNDLSEFQLSKLKTVLETILDVRVDLPSTEEIIRKFESSKRLVGVKETTIGQYVLEINTLLKNTDKPIYMLTTPDIKNYLASYREKRNISMVTIQNKLRFLSSFFEFMFDEGFIDKNPIKGIGRIFVEKRIKKAFTPEDLARIRGACTSIRDRALIEFLYSTGARVSECVSLTVKDINFASDELIVFGKGHKERICYLNKTAHSILEQYLELRKAKPEEPLFSRYNAVEPLTPRAVELILKNIGTAATVHNVHPHRFRRTFATDLWKAKVPVETIRILMGHSNIQTTLRYIDIDPCGVKLAYQNAMSK